MISLADDSGMFIQVCTWAGTASRLDLQPGRHVMAVKGCRVVNNYGKQMNLGDDAYFEIDPKTKRAQELMEWYRSTPYDQIKNINGKSQTDNFTSYSGPVNNN